MANFLNNLTLIFGVKSGSDLRKVIKFVIIFTLGQGVLCTHCSTNNARCFDDNSCKENTLKNFLCSVIRNTIKKKKIIKIIKFDISPVVLHFLRV